MHKPWDGAGGDVWRGWGARRTPPPLRMPAGLDTPPSSHGRAAQYLETTGHIIPTMLAHSPNGRGCRSLLRHPLQSLCTILLGFAADVDVIH